VERYVITYFDIDELAQLMGISTGTLLKKLRLAPATIPPKMHLSGTKMLRWRRTDVDAWIVETGWSRGPSGGGGGGANPPKLRLFSSFSDSWICVA
jgi:predicted DNA-binding transcriptional regulator AlpA